MLIWIRILSKKHNIEIKRIRLDNSGENRSLQKECDKANLGITFEFTAPGTPQQNSVVERRIPTLMGRARAMLIQAGIESKYKGEFWCEVISTATKLDNIMVRPERTKPLHTLFYGEDANYSRSLRTFGEMAVIAIHEGKKMRSKLDDRGKTCMFVEYADDHTKDVYRFLNIHTRRTILSRDVRWLNIIWKQYKKKSLYARRQVELFLYEEEKSLGDERSFGESSIEEIEEDESENDGNNPVENSSSRFYLISCSQGILNSSRLLLLSSPKIACLHVSFTAYENFYKLSKMHCHLVLTFHFLILRMSECRNPTIKHISTCTLVSSSITTYVTDLFLGSNLHSKIPF